MDRATGKRSKVFLSYSHKDEEPYLEEFKPYLKSLSDRGILDFWSDHRITASERWHEEIQSAIESAAAAVLLVSQDLLASDYIRLHEIPPLLEARERDGVPVACLFLKPSLVGHEGMVFAAGTAGKAVRLTDYQGLNSPEHPLSAMDENERARAYVAAAEWISRVISQPARGEGFQQPSPEQRKDLFIRLGVARGSLERTYFVAGTKITEHRSPWPPLRDRLSARAVGGPYALRTDVGEALFLALLVDDRVAREVLAASFESAPGIEPRPILGPVRVRIATEDPLLGSLPWHHTAWEGERLWESAGWTFERVASSFDAEATEPSDVLLKAPCPVLLVGPNAGSEFSPALEVHFRAVEEILHRAWPAYTESPRRARDAQGIEQAFGERRPRIVYCFLEKLELDGRAIMDLLRESWGVHPPQVLLVNLRACEEIPPRLRTLLPASGGVTGPPRSGHVELATLPDLGTPAPCPTRAGAPSLRAGIFSQALSADPLPEGIEAFAGLHPQVSLIVVQCSPDVAQLQASALDWLHTLLEGGEDVDPVCAFHAYGVERAVVWGAYGRWRTRTAREPPREKLAHLLLDRKLQRAVVRTALDELVHEGDRRLCCLFGYGAEGNLVDLLALQIFEHLRRTAQEVAHVSRLKLHLPEGSAEFDAGAVAA
jgi:hypothetical protein